MSEKALAMDLIRGQRVVITGATSGIGRVTAEELARRGAQLAIVCRNPDRGRTTAAEIEEAVPGSAVDVLLADLSELDQVRSVAKDISDRYEHVDVLVNNAGVQDLWARETSTGLDHMLASNYLGPFLLTNLLLDSLRGASAARVVVVASDAHRMAGRIDPESFEHLGDYSGGRPAIRAYARTKLLDLLFTFELARRLDGTSVTANALCPGLVATNLVEGGPAFGGWDRMLSRTFLVRTPEQGARVVVNLASDPSLSDTSGRYFPSTPGSRFLPSVRAARNAALQRRIWDRTTELVGLT
jgi:NAD(P)-dependent dehydrogenase (short-subunit alcohol dehydrogenase family)